MPVSTPEDMAEAEGPNASLEFGDATKMSALNRESGVLATGGQGQQALPPQVQQQQAQAQQPPQPQPPQQPSVQPAPQKRDFSPNKYLSPPKVGKGPIAQGWRDEIRLMASHPNAGPALKALKRLVDRQS